MKRLLALGTAIALLAVGASTAAHADSQVPSPDKAQLAWKVPINNDWKNFSNPFTELWVTQAFAGGMPLANIPHLNSHLGEFPFKDAKLCAQVDESCMPGKGWSAQGYGFLQQCADSPIAPCIESLEYADASGDWHTADVTLKADLSAPNQDNSWINPWGNSAEITATQKYWGWSAVPSAQIPGSGKGPLVFSFPGRLNVSGVDTYALDATFNLNAWIDEKGSLSSSVDNFNFQVSPVKVVDCQNSTVSVTVLQKTKQGTYDFGQTGGSCLDPSLFTGPKYAGFATRFADNFPLRLTLQLPKSISGWFQGRMQDAEITVKSKSAKVDSVTVTGKPTVVPATHRAYTLHDQTMQSLFSKPEFDWARQTESFGYKGITGPYWAPEQGLAPFDQWAPYLDKNARGSVSMWAISHFASSSHCMNGEDGLQGLVTTNAMVYQPETPLFQDGMLTYRVGGVHYDTDGQVQLGNYRFIMKHSVAQCLYGFSNAPISGTVSVTSSDGKEQVAYTNVTDRDGWLTLSADGFTFSSPTISAKLTQEKSKPVTSSSPSPSPIESSSPGPTVTAKKTTITCVKGKLTKKVTAVSPKCPAGYKKKA